MILCDECGQRPAAIHVTAIINGEKQDINLCHECASRRKEFSVHMSALADKLGMLFRQRAEHATQQPESEPVPAVTCPTCGTTYAIFRKTGRLGCGDCYEAFRGLLTEWLKKRVGAGIYAGSDGHDTEGALSGRMEIIRLKKAQKAAVDGENYELAAQLRDQIRIVQSQLEGHAHE